MFFLAGLLGMMVLGSIAIIGTSEVSVDGFSAPAADLDATDAAPDGAHPLFSRLGLFRADSETTVLTDFDSIEDQLVIIYDDSETTIAPDFGMRISDANPDMTEFVVDGMAVLSMPTVDVPPPDAIALLGESSAARLGLG